VCGRVVAQTRRHAFHGFGGDQRELDARQPGRGLDEAVGDVPDEEDLQRTESTAAGRTDSDTLFPASCV
jgi:hypothetical protein